MSTVCTNARLRDLSAAATANVRGCSPRLTTAISRPCPDVLRRDSIVSAFLGFLQRPGIIPCIRISAINGLLGAKVTSLPLANAQSRVIHFGLATFSFLVYQAMLSDTPSHVHHSIMSSMRTADELTTCFM